MHLVALAVSGAGVSAASVSSAAIAGVGVCQEGHECTMSPPLSGINVWSYRFVKT
jgi:hypothetical protein